MIKTGSTAPSTSGGGGGSQNIQQVLNKGNTADGSLPLIFDDGGGNTNTMDETGCTTIDKHGNTAFNDSTSYDVVDKVGNRSQMYLPGDGTARAGVEEHVNGTILEFVADEADGAAHVSYRNNGKEMQFVFNSGLILTTSTKANFRLKSLNENVAYLSDIPAAATVVGNFTQTGFTGTDIVIPTTGFAGTPVYGNVVAKTVATAGVLVGGWRVQYSAAQLIVKLVVAVAVGTNIDIDWQVQ